MKTYMVFAFNDYEAYGGMDDFVDDFDTLSDAKEACEQLLKHNENVHVFNIITNEMVHEEQS